MSISQPDSRTENPAAVRRSIREHWILFLVEGVVLMVLGGAAIVVPGLASIAATLFLGWLLLIAGLIGLVTTLAARNAPGFGWSLLSAVLAIGAGVVLLIWPVSGTVSITIVLIAYFVVEGISSILYAFEHRRHVTGRWAWMLFSGVIDLFLAAILFSGLPGTAFWALGLLVGINLVFGGAALIAMAVAARGAGEEPGAA